MIDSIIALNKFRAIDRVRKTRGLPFYNEFDAAEANANESGSDYLMEWKIINGKKVFLLNGNCVASRP